MREGLPSVVVGVGNPFMRDDGFGVVVARELEKLNLGKGVLVLQRQMLDVSLLLLSEDATRVVVVDAVKSGKRPGTLVRFRATASGPPILQVPLSHGMQVADLVKLARKNKIRLCPISVIGVEPADCTIGESMTKAVRDAVPAAVEAVLEELRAG
jgi:hydrogenase maturation protease